MFSLQSSIVVIVVVAMMSVVTARLAGLQLLDRRQNSARWGRHAAVEAGLHEACFLGGGVLAQQQPILDHVVERRADLRVVGGEARVARFDRGARVAARSAIGFGARERDELPRALAAVVRLR